MSELSSLQPEPPEKVAALVGNGLSIAFNPSLRMPELTRSILERIRDESGPAAHDALVASVADPNDASNFEALFGPIEDLREDLRRMLALSDMTADPNDAREWLAKTTDVFLVARRRAVSHALEQIDCLAEAHHDGMGAIDQFLDALRAVSGVLTIANLNYDSLVMSSLVDRCLPRHLCDMKRGGRPERFEILGPGQGYYLGRPLREIADLLPGGWADLDRRKVRLLHLHGSLTWLQHPETGAVYAFGAREIRESGYWSAWREGRTRWEPALVLTNQARKSAVVAESPFREAYRAFAERLREADRWVIAGYSFGDECVNAMLAEAWREHDRRPPVLVVTQGTWPTREEVLRAVGFDDRIDGDPSDFLYLYVDGVASVPGSEAWVAWQSEPVASRDQDGDVEPEFDLDDPETYAFGIPDGYYGEEDDADSDHYYSQDPSEEEYDQARWEEEAARMREEEELDLRGLQ